jgi:hypothetical protein
MDRPEKNKTREQTYMELMVEMMEEFIKELINKLTYGKSKVRTYMQLN